jgi:manganese/zinc/iron transport system permease protein
VKAAWTGRDSNAAAPAVTRCALRRSAIALALVFATLLFVPELHAAKIGDLTTTSVSEQLQRFLAFGDPVVRAAVIGAVLLGIACGVLGSFLLVRKLALAGDVLAHAVLPGVALGFLWSMNKDPVAMTIGAVAAGVLGTAGVTWIKETTHIKEDSALGLVLGAFYAVGIALITMIMGLPEGNKGGLDKFLFGQAAALAPADLWFMGGVAVVAVTFVTLLYKELLTSSFDPGFARAAGMPVRVLQALLMLLLAFAVVTGLQAVGAVLLSAMLITPAAAAYLLSDRMPRMLLLAGAFGVFAGLLGVFLSFLGSNYPTGPFMVAAASTVFLGAFLLAPRHGVLPRLWRTHSGRARERDENTLKAIYHVRESNNFAHEHATIADLSHRLRETPDEIRRRLRALQRAGYTLALNGDDRVYLNPEGWLRACAVVRNHRLWELYLTHSAHYAADHVHDDAEVIEHVLGEETVRRLERLLDFPARDPHGKLIPSLTDLQRSLSVHPERPEPSGYRQPSA